MHKGVAAELVLPENTAKSTTDAIRSSHIFSPTKLMIEKDSLSWNNDLKVFECSGSGMKISTTIMTSGCA